MANRDILLRAATAILAMTASGAAGAQALSTPGQNSVKANVLKAEPLEATPERIAALKVPDGFKVDVFARGLEAPRVLVVADDGSIYVSSRQEGTITRLEGSQTAGSPRIVLRKENVHGLAVHGGELFYTTVKEVFAAPIEADGTLGAERTLVSDLPDAGQHPNRTIAFGPDGLLYVSVGSTCNECDESNRENATILRMRPDGSAREVVASGLRNTIGFDWQPGTDVLFGWDNGVDWLGDDQTPEEFNRIDAGQKYGWPFVFGDGLHNFYREPKGGTVAGWDEASRRPELTYTAHAASMQFAFYSGAQFPAQYRGDGFVAMKGSWNRNPPSGYEVLRVRFEDNKPVAAEPFLSGFLVEGGPSGWGRFARPFGIAVAKDGSLLVGEEQNGLIYRVHYVGSGEGTAAE